MVICSVCGGTAFAERAVLWDKLVSEWQLAPHERSYIDRQQGTCCAACATTRDVWIGPGEIQFALMPSGPSSRHPAIGHRRRGSTCS